MARTKRWKKQRQKRNYARDISDAKYTEESQYVDRDEEEGNQEQESVYQVPPELAPYALTRPSQIPSEVRKYWKRRTSLFSHFDGSSPTGMLPLLDEQSWFSITPESIAARISQRCRCNIVLDAFCGAGGNAIQFAFTCQYVIAIDIDPVKLLLARHNAEVYGVKDKITFLLGDWRDFAKDWLEARKQTGAEERVDDKRWMGCEKWDIDVVFLVSVNEAALQPFCLHTSSQSPPWGGIDYRNSTDVTQSAFTNDSHVYNFYSLSRLEPTGAQELYNLAAKITPNICMYLPRTVDLNELAALVPEDDQRRKSTFLDIEEQWLGNRCKAISCYFGSLIEEDIDKTS